MIRPRPGATLLAFGTLCSLASWLPAAFVGGPKGLSLPRQAPALRVSASLTDTKAPAPAPKESKEPKSDKEQEEIDDAVLQMAMAMAQEEETGERALPPPPEQKKKDKEWDWNLLITFFLSALVVYSVGSSIISIATGRIQDRTGGDFTAYDFFDNIFSFKEWSLEYTLGFDPFKVWDQLKGGGKS
mmetsp:Transcript_86001/g.199967  ORF Transcript_86001/g.199967 Transcript_86001/m.199967 type:complete len:186 (-) Transcript_86001:107-664(-)|eukprot:CAMPEP_0171096424 /NCGR_PEP_ID=MMETSP0766_2-20121228/44656_1 /TAXON_ID=439317 /ORGANISM="Gambierdiscus australes, Strain CAWD 149" /LENGTH=185 /DNA_ID=CAMNT_0011555403 /DNA_START=70 /DNA_END=627 /DNA_ORIENTATION=+